MICIKSLKHKNRVYPLDGFKFSLGSDDDCDIAIPDSALNDVHALLWVGDDYVTVMTVQDAFIAVDDVVIKDRVKVRVGGKLTLANLEMEVIDSRQSNSAQNYSTTTHSQKKPDPKERQKPTSEKQSKASKRTGKAANKLATAIDKQKAFIKRNKPKNLIQMFQVSHARTSEARIKRTLNNRKYIALGTILILSMLTLLAVLDA